MIRSAVIRSACSILFLGALINCGCSSNSPYMVEIENTPSYQCSATENLKHRILFIGDAGEPEFEDYDLELSVRTDEKLKMLCGNSPDICVSNPALVTLYMQAMDAKGISTIIFLGDNVYPDGFTSSEYQTNARILDAQIITVTASGARGIFVPGNHDWERGNKNGLSNIRAQNEYINKHLNNGNVHEAECFFPVAACGGQGVGAGEEAGKFNPTDVKSGMLPPDGFPGPCKVDEIDGIRIIALDSQWWIHRHKKSAARCADGTVKTMQETARCESTAETESIRDAIVEEVNGLLASDDRETIIVSHHPVKSHGEHGGFYDYRYYFFPGTVLYKYLYIPFLPLYPPLRWYVFKDDQDMVGCEYQWFIGDMRTMSEGVKRPLVAAGGHDHGLQVLNGGEFAKYAFVSGAGSEDKVKESAVSYESDTYFSHLHTGFIQLDVLNDDSMYLCVVEPGVDTPDGAPVITPRYVYVQRLK